MGITIHMIKGMFCLRANVLLSLACVLLLGSQAFAMSDKPKPPTEEQQQNLEEMKKTAIISGAPDCEGDSVILEMGEVKLNVPRGRQIIHSNDIGKVHGLIRPRQNYRCDEVIKNVVTYRSHPYLIGVRPERGPSSGYQGMLELFERNNAALDRSTDEHGVEWIKIVSVDPNITQLPPEGSKAEYYVLPKELSPTDNDEPIAYTCSVPPPPDHSSKGYCQTTYYHQTGLYISYKFHRDNPSVEFLLVGHQRHLDFLKSVLIEP